MTLETIEVALGCGVLGGAAALIYSRLQERALRAELTNKQRELADTFRRDSEAAQLSARIAAQEQVIRDRAELEKSLAGQRTAIAEDERRLAERESLVNRQLDRFGQVESDLRQRAELIESSRTGMEGERTELRRLTVECKARLEQVSGLDSASARTLLLKEIERESAKDAADLSRHILDDAKHRSEEQARRILATALQRYAATHTFETTTATVALSGEDMKGRIIGREGRNIRAFEAATGVTVLVDDTPNAVVLSGFDPVRREVARQSLSLIHISEPTRPY